MGDSVYFWRISAVSFFSHAAKKVSPKSIRTYREDRQVSRWYRAYEGTVTDPKLAEAAMIVGCSRALSIATWHCILESAASVNNCGTFNTVPRRIAAVLCEPLAPVEALFAAFEELGLIGSSTVSSWKKRQFHSDDSAERVRQHRARKKAETPNEPDVTACNGDVTPPETETEVSSVSNETLAGSPEIEGEEGLTLRPEHLQEAWNAGPGSHGAVECRRLKSGRRRRAVQFLRRHPIEDITEAITAVARSDFLCGRGRGEFRADIAFLFSDEHMTRLLEGFYDR